MNTLRVELETVFASGHFATKEAKQLLGYDWHSLASELPPAVRQEAEVLYHLVLGTVEEVEEGYVTDQDDPDMRKRIEQFLNLLPKGG